MRKCFFLFFPVMFCLGCGQYSGYSPIRFLGGYESLRANSDSNILTVNNGSVSPISDRSIAFAWKGDAEGIGDIVLTYIVIKNILTNITMEIIITQKSVLILFPGIN